MTSLAAEFGWSEEFILTQLPISRGEQYYHALLRRQGWITTAPEDFDADEQEAVLAQQRAENPVPWGSDPDINAAFARLFPEEKQP